MKHGYEQTTPASRCDSSGHGMKFRWIILNYERRGGGEGVVAAADWPHGIAGQAERRGAPAPWLGAGLGTDGPRLTPGSPC